MADRLNDLSRRGFLTSAAAALTAAHVLGGDTAAAQVDCNRAVGSYTLNGNNLTLSFLITSLAACPPGSLADRYQQNLNKIKKLVLAI